jgi:hypothetical protein
MEITCYRDAEIGRETRHLPAPVYNLTRRLIARSPSGIVFVPIRSMQYLAILDREEIVFIDHQYKNRIEIAWQHFQPQSRASLDEAVAYEAVMYRPDGTATMQRLMGEFPKALQLLEARGKIDGPSRVLKFEKTSEKL